MAESASRCKRAANWFTDTTKLDKALTNLEGLKGLFANKADALAKGGGIAVNFKNFTDKLLSFDGTLNAKTNYAGAHAQEQQRCAGTRSIPAQTLEKRLYAQYSALDTKMASLNALNAYISRKW